MKSQPPDGKPTSKIPNEQIVDIVNRLHSEDAFVREGAERDAYYLFRPWVIKFGQRNFGSYWQRYKEDMFQSGMCGLFKSLKTYNPAISAPLTYLTFGIRHEMHTFIAQYVHETTRHYISQMAKVTKARQKLAEAGNEDPSPAEIAIESGMSPELVLKVMEQQRISQTTSLSDESFMDTLVSNQETPERAFAQNERERIIKEALDSLDEESREIIIAKQRLRSAEKRSDTQIAADLNMPAAKIRAQYVRALRKLRANPQLRAECTEYIQKDRKVNEVSFVPMETAKRIAQELMEEDSDNSTEQIK